MLEKIILILISIISFSLFVYSIWLYAILSMILLVSIAIYLYHKDKWKYNFKWEQISPLPRNYHERTIEGRIFIYVMLGLFIFVAPLFILMY